ncbi:MAG: AbrB/MazE/SpoVT family DNA-binding domain-containing protein [Chloroflexi bacterium]|nr:AbrB/MazE/SpoVT family DNA-binding domain-containing protein [Chloroflexota bacterium]
MSQLIQVRRKAQVTLPQSVRRALNIEEGDLLDIRVKDGEIVLRVKKLVDKEQAWFWTRRWQEGERKAEEDIRSGHIHSFDRAKEATAFLHKRAKKGSGATNEA